MFTYLLLSGPKFIRRNFRRRIFARGKGDSSDTAEFIYRSPNERLPYAAFEAYEAALARFERIVEFPAEHDRRSAVGL